MRLQAGAHAVDALGPGALCNVLLPRPAIPCHAMVVGDHARPCTHARTHTLPPPPPARRLQVFFAFIVDAALYCVWQAWMLERAEPK